MFRPEKLLSASAVLGKACWEDDGVIKIWNGNEEDSKDPLSQEQIDAIEAHYSSALAEFNSLEYARNRADAYPDLGDQLDMLYHDIKNGTLETGEWITAIEAVKAANPKP